MKLVVVSDIENVVDSIVAHGSSLGFDMLGVKNISNEIIVASHAIIYVTQEAITEAHEQLEHIVDLMHNHGLKRLVVCAPKLTNNHVLKSGLDWTVIDSQHTDSGFSEFVIGQVTSARNINRSVSLTATT